MKYIDYQRDLAEERSRLQSELEVASVIQHSLLPVISESYPGRSEFEISASMEAAKVVGGDFYDFFFVEKDKLALVIADVSGKGVPAALFMAKAKMVLQNCIRDIPDLQEALHTANNVLCERNTAEMFLTAWIGVLDIKSGSIDYVCAGHNPPVVVSGDSVEFVRTRGGFVLAGIEDMRYKTHHLTLKEGDILFLYTDGVTEAEDDVQELYGEKRLEDCLSMSHPSDAAAVIRLVRDDVATFVKGTAQSDDMTMLSVKMNSAG